MVRRRTRAAKQQAALTNGVAVVVPANVLEEQYYASPKRKDCKVDCSSGVSNCGDLTKVGSNGKSLGSMGRTKAERSASRTIGVPLATRSQTRCIDNFFKAKTASSKINENEHESGTEESLPSPPLPCSALHIVSHLSLAESDGVAAQSQNEYIFELSEDTNDDETDQTEASDETISNGVGGINAHISEIDFAAHRSVTLEDSYSSRSSTNTTDNIFLQEPVLTLNVDKTLNQASSIKINKSIEIEPVFSSPPALASSALHGRFNQIVSLNGCASDIVKLVSPTKRASSAYDMVPTPKMNGCFVLLPENDNSSCDSGVGFTSSLENNDKSNNSMLAISPFVLDNQMASRRRKPATPHRILCPSPTKAAPRTISHSGRVISPSPGRKKDQLLSPRKSPRHISTVAAVTSKSRRRLNPPSLQQMEKAPYKFETKKTAVQNGYEHQDGIIDLCTDADDDDIVIIKNPNEEFENNDKNSKITAPKIESTITKIPETTKTTAIGKSNAAVNAKQKQQYTLPPKTIITTNSTATIKTKATTIKHQMPQPLTSTNSGNRELTEFFPVRRSVRKTKTAVKEEMMRSLEQAVLEERADGLKVAHFEGKGRGVIADRRFQRGEFVVEYIGDLISITEATEREKQYALDENAGCYMYYFKHKNQQYCIDATVDTGKLGRLVNHSRNGNLLTKVVVVKQRPHLVLLAKDDILPGEELTYDYGDRSKESLLHHPWLAF